MRTPKSEYGRSDYILRIGKVFSHYILHERLFPLTLWIELAESGSRPLELVPRLPDKTKVIGGDVGIPLVRRRDSIQERGHQYS